MHIVTTGVFNGQDLILVGDTGTGGLGRTLQQRLSLLVLTLINDSRFRENWQGCKQKGLVQKRE